MDIWLRKKRDTQAAYAFLKRLHKQFGQPRVIVTDKAPSIGSAFRNMLLSPFEMQDTKIMSGLQVHVYPLYDELKELRGLNSVKDHLSYVASRREEYSKHNITRYLKKAIEQYLPTVKRQDLNHE